MKLGVIGCGKMGGALLGGVLEAGLCAPESVSVHDAFPGAVEAAVTRYGVRAAGSNAAAVESSDAVLLCVKPQMFPEMLASLGGVEGRLLISIAAGVRLAAIESAIGGRHRVIRVMPNT
ncbi:MAG: NAD(P)-binding domain-containing protein, partial [Verrucomicrobiae bacterium]|nr:NAD(P)-binding domain-containing protein [Verrucomicrobiae bacterium]